jgi:hypothetical protein
MFADRRDAFKHSHREGVVNLHIDAESYEIGLPADRCRTVTAAMRDAPDYIRRPDWLAVRTR